MMTILYLIDGTIRVKEDTTTFFKIPDHITKDNVHLFENARNDLEKSLFTLAKVLLNAPEHYESMVFKSTIERLLVKTLVDLTDIIP